MGMFDHLNRISSVTDEAAPSLLWLPRPRVSGCRLSLDRTRAVTTADQTTKNLIYVVPHESDIIECWSGEDWVPRRVPYDLGSTQTRKALALDLAGVADQTNYDVFVRNVSGTWEIKYQGWMTSNTRNYLTAFVMSPEVHPDGLGIFQGRLCRVFQGAPLATNSYVMPEWLYLGTFVGTASGQTEDSRVKRMLYNFHNQVERPLLRIEPAGSWTYATSAWRQANANTLNEVACVTGLSQVACTTIIEGVYEPGSIDSCVGIGVDSTTPSANCVMHYVSSSYGLAHSASLQHTALGRRTYKWCEQRVSAGTVNFYGTTTYGGLVYAQCGMTGYVFA